MRPRDGSCRGSLSLSPQAPAWYCVGAACGTPRAAQPITSLALTSFQLSMGSHARRRTLLAPRHATGARSGAAAVLSGVPHMWPAVRQSTVRPRMSRRIREPLSFSNTAVAQCYARAAAASAANCTTKARSVGSVGPAGGVWGTCISFKGVVCLSPVSTIGQEATRSLQISHRLVTHYSQITRR